ncbi:MAG TPA: LuxR C-terminal-related transcriptional regulator [Streptosporangiaceae bacterium]
MRSGVALGIRPGGDPVLRWHDSRLRLADLTRREFQVFMLLGQGLSNRDISGCLHIGERTVKLHVSSVLRKLLLESRLQAGLTAAEHVLVSSTGREPG